MKEIALTQGKVALVDDRDFKLVRSLRWHADKRRSVWYAGSSRFGFMHRFIMKPKAGLQVDHINGDGLDNRRRNLRVCTNAENSRNNKGRRNLTSKFKGVSKDRRLISKPWMAYIKVDYKRFFLGRHATEEEAARAYNVAAKKHFGEFARPNPL